MWLNPTKVSLNGAAAPLGYDKKGKLVLVLSGKGTHQISISASAVLKELDRGGMSCVMSLPPAVAGKMTLRAPGDLEVHADQVVVGVVAQVAGEADLPVLGLLDTYLP